MTLRFVQDCRPWNGVDEKKSILFGNGLNTTCPFWSDHFCWNKLLEQSGIIPNSLIWSLVDKLISFEKALYHLASVKDVLDPLKFDQIRREIRRGLMRGVAYDKLNGHEISNDQAKNSLERIINFMSNFERVFTVNYDPLFHVYHLIRYKGHELHDGFIPNLNELIWKPKFGCPNFFFLHGNIQFYEEHDGRVIQKVNSSQRCKLDQAFSEGKEPLVVIEGTSEEKMSAIRNSTYLTYSFKKILSSDGHLFVLGMSFENDDHILDAILKCSRFSHVWFGIRGSRCSEAFHKIAHKILKVGKPNRIISIFETDLEKVVWGKTQKIFRHLPFQGS